MIKTFPHLYECVELIDGRQGTVRFIRKDGAYTVHFCETATNETVPLKAIRLIILGARHGCRRTHPPTTA